MKINQMNYDSLIKNGYDKGKHYFVCLYNQPCCFRQNVSEPTYIECFGTLDEVVKYCDWRVDYPYRLIPYVVWQLVTPWSTTGPRSSINLPILSIKV